MKSEGQKVLEGLAGWIGSWLAFPDVPGNQPLVLALWVIHTWFAPVWPVATYLHITSDGPGCGKTTLMEVLAALSRGARVRATLRALSVVRDIEEHASAVTYFFDQVEALQHTRLSDEQAILLTGYRKGGEHGISVGQKQVSFSTYCVKAFACIGGVARDLASRSVVVRLGFGVPRRDWSDAVMVRQAEADHLLDGLADAFGVARSKLGEAALPWVSKGLEGFAGREKEIYTPLWSVASALNLDAATTQSVLIALADFAAFKADHQPKSYRELAGAAVPKDEQREMADRLVRDLAVVMDSPDEKLTGDVASVVAVERLVALVGSPWRVINGGYGLSVDIMAKLLARHGVAPDVVRPVRGRKGKQVRGYRRADVLAALRTLEGGARV